MDFSYDIGPHNWSLLQYIRLIFISSTWTIFKKAEITIFKINFSWIS